MLMTNIGNTEYNYRQYGVHMGTFICFTDMD